MKNLGIFLTAITLGLMTVFTTSCSKEQGCTDPDSKNFSSTAEEDDGSCQYEGSVIFWYGANLSQELVDDGAISLTYYIDDQIVGSSSASVYWNGNTAPDCGQQGLLTITKDLGNVKTQAATYKIIDQDNFEYFSGVINFNANTCLAIELSAKKKK
jgi:hypothetical protein